ncbi:hypothetical protein BVG80_18050 [Sphingobacteriales bacterium TSM_CSM]|nr:hypothetical protein BVG80_18050 [Sphingobacteriales bacterium TSM_CSM]
MSAMWFDAIQMFFLLLVTSVLTYLVFCWRKTSRMAKELDDLQAQLKDLQAQNTVLTDRNAKFEALNLQLKTDLENANEQVGHLNAELRGAKEQSADRLMRIQTLEPFETQFIDLSNRFVALETESGNLKLEMQKALNDKEQITKSLSEKEAAFKALEERYNALLNSSNQLKAEMEAITLQLSASNSEKKELGLQTANLTTQLGDVEAGNNALLQNIENLYAENEELKSDTDRLNAQLNAKEALIVELQNKLAAFNAGTSETDAEKTRLAANLEDQNTSITDLNALVEALSAQVGDLEMNKSNLDDNLSSLSLLVSDKDAVITELQGKIASLTVHLADKESDNERLNKDLAECRSMYKATAKELEETEKELSEEERKLEEMKKKVALINFERIGFATAADKDDLQLIKGIGPFIEQKLNAIGIYTFRQIANFTPEDVDRVTDAIEFFPGRIERDSWIPQADEFAKAKGK